eukprot:1443223-Pleurochrysis_carterae.AAC.2
MHHRPNLPHSARRMALKADEAAAVVMAEHDVQRNCLRCTRSCICIIWALWLVDPYSGRRGLTALYACKRVRSVQSLWPYVPRSHIKLDLGTSSAS